MVLVTVAVVRVTVVDVWLVVVDETMVLLLVPVVDETVVDEIVVLVSVPAVDVRMCLNVPPRARRCDRHTMKSACKNLASLQRGLGAPRTCSGPTDS